MTSPSCSPRSPNLFIGWSATVIVRLMVDDFADEEYELRVVVDAAQTMPFLTEKRVVVARNIGRFTAEDVAPLIAIWVTH